MPFILSFVEMKVDFVQEMYDLNIIMKERCVRFRKNIKVVLQGTKYGFLKKSF